MNYDPFIPLSDSGVYSIGDSKSPWQDLAPSELRAALQGGIAPLFRSALAKVDEDTFAGPLYFDIDDEDIGTSIAALHRLVDNLSGTGLDLEGVRFFASGKKGFHLEVLSDCFRPVPAPTIGLPRIYRGMALSVFVDGIDLRVYSGGRGRLWRVPNIERDNGAFKVPVSLNEVKAMTPDLYANLVSAPRNFPPLAPPVFCPGLGALYVRASDEVSRKAMRTKAWTKAEMEMRQRFNSECPPSIAAVLRGEATTPLGFNALALQVCLMAHALGWDEDRLLRECTGLIKNHSGDGHRYASPRKREIELSRMFGYVDSNGSYDFSVAGLRSILQPGTRSPDLQGLEADASDGAPDYADLINEADDAGAVVAVARRIVADDSLSRTEAESLIKRAAKSAGVSTKVLRADLYTPSAADGLFIDVVRSDFAGSVDSAMRALASVSSLRVQSGRLVEVTGGRIVAVQLPQLAYLLSSVARWRYPDGIGGPDNSVLQTVLGAGEWPGVPELVGIAEAPTVLGDGRIGLPKGYEAQYNDGDFPAYEGTGQEALAELRELLREFPFASEIDESAAVAAILTSVARPTLSTAPAFLITAHDYGSGKTFLAELIASFAAPTVETLRWAQRAEEQDKMLLSLLREGRPVCLFDNLMKNWQSPTLAAILTGPMYSDRLLGVSEAVTVSTRCLIIATGNNIKAGTDLSRRVVSIELDPRCENPLTRRFSGNPVAEVHRHRGRWVMSALRVLQDYLRSGDAPTLTPLASFNEWSALVRGALVWYGLPDILQGVVAQVANDGEREVLGFILEAWHECFGDEPMTLRDVIRSIGTSTPKTPRGELLCLFDEVAGKGADIDFRALGGWMSSHAGQVVGGRRLVSGARTYKGTSWQVVKT